MKIITYSDLHLEFGTDFLPPTKSDADIMILAGDIITFRDYTPLDRFLSEWKKPVIFVAGNHEYYTNTPMTTEVERFKNWLKNNHPNVHFLQDEAITIDGVHFFGGTMWTDFQHASEDAMLEAIARMNDYRYIKMASGISLTPSYTIKLHNDFVQKLVSWFEANSSGKRVIITHHAPVVNPNTKYTNSPIMPAFNSIDMLEIIEKYQPYLWVYGHTHEGDDHTIGKTRIISNQLGYENRYGGYECGDFDTDGKPIVL